MAAVSTSLVHVFKNWGRCINSTNARLRNYKYNSLHELEELYI
jgi:hypothetical protein